MFGLVAATGTNLEEPIRRLSEILTRYDYEPITLHLTQLLQEHVLEPGSVTWRSEAERIERWMDAGDQFRERSNQRDAMAMLAVLGIHEHRRPTGARPQAFLLRQLKHPDEVGALRRIYGDRFFAISLSSTHRERLSYLQEQYGIEGAIAERLMRRDEDDELKYFGQRTRDAFELGDVFLRFDAGNPNAMRDEAERFLDLVFGNPKLSPRLHEHAMYLAYSASLRSVDLSRQVGASLLNTHGDIVALGANDVPCAGGGQYWPGSGDRRDHAVGYDSNNRQKLVIARDVFERLHPDLEDDRDAFASFLKQIGGSLLFDITEYGRAVHAEMEALMSCARTGTSTRGGRLFSTTFPCHNCAKHIVGAGIVEVQYVEAYPKSKATPLYRDQIYWDETALGNDASGKVVFKHYVGIGPRRYLDLFSLALGSGQRVKRKGDDGNLASWIPSTAKPRVPLSISTTKLEDQVIARLRTAMKERL